MSDELNVETMTQAVLAALTHPETLLGRLAAEVALMRRNLRPQGRPFSISDGGATDAGGAGVIAFPGPQPGQIWYLERVAVSVGGASAAARVGVYIDTATEERNLVDNAGAMVGNAPSRAVFVLIRPQPVWGGIPVLVSVGGAVAAQPITARISGRVIEVLETSGLRGELGQETSEQA